MFQDEAGGSGSSNLNDLQDIPVMLNATNTTADSSNFITGGQGVQQGHHVTYTHPVTQDFLLEASFGRRVLSLPAPVCLSIHLSVCQSQVCPHDNSSLVQAKSTKFRPEVENTLVKILIVLLYPPQRS